MLRQIALAAFLWGFTSAAWAQAPMLQALPDGANYPDPSCNKPQVNMVKPPTDHIQRVEMITQNDSEAVRSYNSKIKQFNSDMAAYNGCMRAYIDKANGDVKTIQDKANGELKQITERANTAMKMIQDKIRQAVTDANSVNAALDQETTRPRNP